MAWKPITLSLLLGLCLPWVPAAIANPDRALTRSAKTSPRIAALIAQPDPAAVAAFWRRAERDGTPLIEKLPRDTEHVLATYLWRGDDSTRNVVILSQFPGGAPADNQMAHISGTDVWYRSYVVPAAARLPYTLSPNDDLTPLDAPNLNFLKRFEHVQLDPLNKHRFPQTGGGPSARSVLEGPDAPPIHWTAKDDRVPAGQVIKRAVQFRDGISRKIQIYLPAGFEPSRITHIAFILDGESYIETIPTPTILDNLIAARMIPATIAVFVDGGSQEDRERDTACSASFSAFLANQLLPRIKGEFHLGATRTLIAGSSRGGLAATCAGMHHPNIFNDIVALSSSYWWKSEAAPRYEEVVHRFEASSPLPLRFYVSVGTLETLARPTGLTQLSSNRHFRDVLLKKGYPLTYSEFVGDHDYVNWQRPLAEGLIALWGHHRPR